MQNDDRAKLNGWVAALERRYLADLRIQEVTRALRALSAAYVEHRGRGTDRHVRGALDSAGKRAAFAMYYAPLHFIAVLEVVRALGADQPAPASILDLGCGTGAAAAAWAIAAGSTPVVKGIDRHPWAVSEASRTYRELGLQGRARQGDFTDPGFKGFKGFTRFRGFTAGAVAAYVLNELADAERRRVENVLVDLGRLGGRILVVEPIARGVVPWWPETAERIRSLGGRADEWRFPIEAPPTVARLGDAAGLNHRELRLQTLLL
jgi:SAM-dependent methyltransferase